MADSAKDVADVDSGMPETKRQLVAGMMIRCAFCLSAPLFFLGGCSSEPAAGELNLNQPGGLILSSPGFLTGRAIDESLVELFFELELNSESEIFPLFKRGG